VFVTGRHTTEFVKERNVVQRVRELEART
jgi:hypothetical protein